MTTQVKKIGRGVNLIQKIEPVTMTLDEYLQGKYKVTRDELSARSKMLIGRIEKYVDTMNLRTINTQENIVKQQSAFLQTVLGILESDSKDAMLMWDVLLFMAYKHESDLFNDRTACRMYHLIPEAQQRPFLALMTLVVSTANVRNRANALRTCPLSTVTALLSNDTQKTNLAAYYATNV